MPRDWGQIIDDPTPSVVFEPISKSVPNNAHRSRVIPSFSAIRQALWKSRTTRLKISILILVSGLLGGLCGGIYGGWYLFSDIFFSAILGLAVSTMILLLPELMIAIATGSIISLFCTFNFGTYGQNSRIIFSYFLFGLCCAIVVQLIRTAILMSYQVEIAQETRDKSNDSPKH
jgi:uncharacterized membrane protein YdcZ (DUF606 family)